MTGPYAGFVIPAYLISAGSLMVAIFLIRRRYKNLTATLAKLEKQDQADNGTS